MSSSNRHSRRSAALGMAEEVQKSEPGENERPVSLYPQFEGDLMHKMRITGNQIPRMGHVTVKAPVVWLPLCNPSVEKWKA